MAAATRVAVEMTAGISEDLYPNKDDMLFEGEILRNPFSLKLWWRYLIARAGDPFKKRLVIYECALKALTGSYKLWSAFLRERLDLVRPLPISHPLYDSLNNTFECVLITMHKMPHIWIMYLTSLTEQRFRRMDGSGPVDDRRMGRARQMMAGSGP